VHLCDSCEGQRHQEDGVDMCCGHCKRCSRNTTHGASYPSMGGTRSNTYDVHVCDSCGQINHHADGLDGCCGHCGECSRNR